MRYRLTTLLAATFAAAVLLGLNLFEWETSRAGWHEGSEWEMGLFVPASWSMGWPAVVHEVSHWSNGRRVYFQPWAIAVNAAFGLAVVGAVGAGAEWLARRKRD
ncbi:MAG: hypothetical protein HS116_19375 [Planctomycetes bacterium]|nr:hypothetical protein [Planctomycetota bacterium]